ncbi:hypothetical protein, partial [Kineococcus glutinatus]|uniref:hypothetical protein n=1 Tax=Kineococcus glutinatus TaxID=1070872 RepID=UPI0031F174BB
MSTPASLRRRGRPVRASAAPSEVVSRRLRSKRWKTANSWWLVMPALGGVFLSWIAFLYMGVKGHRARWVLASLGYLLVAGAALGLVAQQTAVATFFGVFLAFAGWGGGLVHSVMANPTWLRIKAALGIEPEAPPVPAAPAAPPTPAELVARLEEDLRAVVRRANAAGGRLPDGAVPRIREIEDVLRPLLARARSRRPDAEAMHNLEAIVREYLPGALDRYLDLPPQLALTSRTSAGTTPAEELLNQLGLLQEGAQQLQQAVVESDVQALATQGR